MASFLSGLSKAEISKLSAQQILDLSKMDAPAAAPPAPPAPAEPDDVAVMESRNLQREIIIEEETGRPVLLLKTYLDTEHTASSKGNHLATTTFGVGKGWASLGDVPAGKWAGKSIGINIAVSIGK